ncbi:MAG TPA: ABC transporter substrate-binding protein [Rubrobacteraceae bacterium]|nr:ABC transporter substrate-binding protein [Rubrobacteraceae bacterium]
MAAERAGPKRRLLSRRRFLGLSGAGLAGAALLGALGGCGPEKAAGPVRLNFSHGEDTGVLRQQISRFNERNRGEIEVELRLAPADSGQYFEKLKTGFQSGEASVDVISGDVIWPAEFAANGWISDLSDHFGAQLRVQHLPATVESNTHEGSVFGVPWFTDAGMLYYRQDLLEESGIGEPPATWEELEEMADKVRRDSGTEHGFVFQGADYEGGVVNGLEFIWNAGGDVLDPDDLSEVTVAEPQAVEGLEARRRLVSNGVAPGAVPSYKEYESYAVFLSGEAVFMRNWPNVYARAADPSQSSVEQERIGVAALPVSRAGDPAYSGLGGWNLMINSASEAKMEAAWTFIRYLSAPEQQKERALENGYLPTLKACYEDRDILAKVPVITRGGEAIRNVRSRPATPFYHEMSLAMAERFHSSLTGTVTPEQAAASLQRDLESILRQAETF